MPLETATYITDLNVADPAHADGLNNADGHIKLIKGTLKATFPNFTSAPLNSTQAQLDAAAASAAAGSAILADAGAFFKTNNTDGFTNPVAGEIDFKLAGAVAASFARVSSVNTFTWAGPITASGAITAASINAAGVVPIGGMILWLTDTLPTVGTWCWANGGTLSRTTFATFFGMVGTSYGAGDGSTTFNVINMQEVVPVGKSTMGGASSPGLLASIASGLKAVLNGIFGADTHTLTASEIPTITSANLAAVALSVTGTAVAGVTLDTAGAGGIGNASANNPIPVTSTGNIAIGNVAVSSNNTGGAAHQILQPSRAVNFIIRIA